MGTRCLLCVVWCKWLWLRVCVIANVDTVVNARAHTYTHNVQLFCWLAISESPNRTSNHSTISYAGACLEVVSVSMRLGVMVVSVCVCVYARVHIYS